MERYGIGLHLRGKRGEKGAIVQKIGNEWVIAYSTRVGGEARELWTEAEMRRYWTPC